MGSVPDLPGGEAAVAVHLFLVCRRQLFGNPLLQRKRAHNLAYKLLLLLIPTLDKCAFNMM
jgi:hypothetical protein